MSYRYWTSKIKTIIDKIRHKEVILTSTKSSWPWWQHVNKNETAIQLTRDVHTSEFLPKPYKAKLIDRNSQAVTDWWVVRIDTHVHKSQKANKEQTYKKLTKIIKSAFKEPTVRKKTTAPKRAVDKRIAEKKRRGKTRSSRRKLVG